MPVFRRAHPLKLTQDLADALGLGEHIVRSVNVDVPFMETPVATVEIAMTEDGGRRVAAVLRRHRLGEIDPEPNPSAPGGPA